MASFILTWAPPVKNVLTQVVQYKLSSAGSWTNAATVSSAASTYQINGLTANTSYDFRIRCNCTEGGITYTAVVTKMSITCPNPTLDRDGTTVTSSFVPNALVSTYKVQLFKNGIYDRQMVYNSPFSNPLNTTFSGLPSGNYQARIVVIIGAFTKTCPLSGILT